MDAPAHAAHRGTRVEDVRLITGAGKYAADWNVKGQSHGYFVRSGSARACAPDTKLQGNHTGGSRTTVGAGSVCYLAAQKLIEQGKALAALEMNVEPSQVGYAKGEFSSSEARRTVQLAELAKSKPLKLMAAATIDALRPLGVQHLDMPLTPATLWHAIHKARRRKAR